MSGGFFTYFLFYYIYYLWVIILKENFVRETKISDLKENEKIQSLLFEINNSKNTLKSIYHNMQFAESDLIDYYTYQIKAEQAKYDYLIKQVKKLN